MTNETINTILTRRSVRQYKDHGINDADIKLMLEAAMSAPSAGNQQPWQFIVIKDRAVLRDCANLSEYSKFAEDAAVGIVVCADLTHEKWEGLWVQDCSAATQNLLLAVKALGYGACWCAIYDFHERMDKFRRELEIPDEIIPFAFISIGHTDVEQRNENRYDAERVHMNRWHEKYE